ncbi:MAG: TAXI family TRAP transporter solute-binding subunit [Pseudomonadota bacterium]
MSKKVCYLLSGFLVLGLFGLQSTKAESTPKVLSLATKPAGTTIYFIAAGMSAVWTKHAGVQVRVEPIPSIKQWGLLMDAGQVDLAIDNAVDSGGAYRADELFKVGKGKLTSFRLLGAGHNTLMTYWTRPDAGIKSIEDFAGKRVVIDVPPGAPTANALGKSLVDDYYKLKGKYIRLTIGNPEECANALIEGRLDVYQFPWTPMAERVHRAVGVQTVPVPKAAAEYVAKKVPGMFPGVVPKGRYGLKEETPCIAWKGQLFARESLDEQLVYTLLDTIYSHLDELHPVHPMARMWVLQNATDSPTVPFHPGAIKFYKDKGVWTPALDRLQQENLAAGK